MQSKIAKVDSTTPYVYDGEANRVKKLVGENTRFIYGIGGVLVSEFDGSSGNLKKEYIAGGITVEPTAVNSNGTQYPTGDHLGSPRVITNSSGSVVSRHDYMPFGEELGAGTGGRTTGIGFSNSGDNNRKKFTGYERDTETGLDFAQARFYASLAGRFTSPDPFSASAIITDPQTFNRYQYCRNNPVNSIDPSGLAAMGVMSQPSGERVNAAHGMMADRRAIVEKDDDARYQEALETIAAANEAEFLNRQVASGAMTAEEASDRAARNPMLEVLNANGFTTGQAKVIQASLTQADKMLSDPAKAKSLDQEGQKSGTPINVKGTTNALRKLKTKFEAGDTTAGYQIINAEKTTNKVAKDYLAQLKKDGKQVGAFVLPGGTDVYLTKLFFQGGNGLIDGNASRSIIMIHESVHVFGPGDEAFRGSTKLTDIIIRGLHHKGLSHRDLSMAVQ